LAGCLSGGGGNSTVSNTPAGPTPFTSWAAVPTPGTVTATGPTLEGSYTSNPQNNFAVTSVSNGTTANGTVQLTFDNNRAVTAASINGARSSASFNTSNGDTIISFANTYFVAASKDGTKLAISANPYLSGVNYQSYGIWETGLGTGSGNF